MYLNKYTNFISSSHSHLLRNIFTCRILLASKNLYDVLEITPNTPMSGIKAAYYKLSKIYHPDVNKDEEAAKKFRAITEAYEVLGNTRLKKLYDKGVIKGDSTIPQAPHQEEETAEQKFHRKRQYRSKVPTDTTYKDYNFNEWIKAHYGEQNKYEQAERMRRQHMEYRDAQHSDQQARGSATIGFIFLIGAMFYMNHLLFSGKFNRYDQDLLYREKNKKED